MSKIDLAIDVFGLSDIQAAFVRRNQLEDLDGRTIGQAISEEADQLIDNEIPVNCYERMQAAIDLDDQYLDQALADMVNLGSSDSTFCDVCTNALSLALRDELESHKIEMLAAIIYAEFTDLDNKQYPDTEVIERIAGSFENKPINLNSIKRRVKY